MIEKKNTLLSIAIALALTGCGGNCDPITAIDGNVVTSATPTTGAGKAVDGYLSAASALCDTNNNGVADTGETAVTTNNLGEFTFSPACSSTVVISGGTSTDTGLPFKGRLKAPAGSKVATPLTSLMVTGGLTAAQAAAAMSLAAGTDVSQLDPMSNAELHKKTLAMQQIIQQIADTLGALAGNSSPAAIQAIYSEVAKAVGVTLAANPAAKLIDAAGNVSTLLVSGIVQQSVKNLATTTDTTLAAVKTSMSGFSPTSLAELVSGAIATEAQTFVKAGDADLLALTKSLQSNNTVANFASQGASLLTSANDSKVNLTMLGSSLQQLTDNDASNDAAARVAISSEVAADCASAGIPTPVIDLGALSQPINTLAIQNDSINLNGIDYTLKQFMAGVTLPTKPAPIDMVSFSYNVNGTPIPQNTNGIMTTRVSMGIELTDTGTSGRVLQFILDQADVTVDSSKQLHVAVPAGAKLYAYGKTSNGSTANVTLTNIAADQFLESANNKLTFNAGKVLGKINASPSATQFSNLQNISGTFNLKVVVSNLSIASQTDQSAVKGLSVAVTGSSQPAVSGLGVQGIFTVH